VIHARQKIREALVALLKGAAIGGVNDNVQGSVFFPVKSTPALYVFAAEETSQIQGGQYLRRVAFAVKLICAAAQGVEDQVDTICADVERTLPAELAGLAQNGALRSTTFERSGDGDEEVMSAELTYVYEYATALYNPGEAIH
jgi:hypothetical protein